MRADPPAGRAGALGAVARWATGGGWRHVQVETRRCLGATWGLDCAQSYWRRVTRLGKAVDYTHRQPSVGVVTLQVAAYEHMR